MTIRHSGRERSWHQASRGRGSPPPRRSPDSSAIFTGMRPTDPLPATLESRTPPEPARAAWRQRLHTIIFEADTPAGRAFDIGLIIAIVVSVILVIVESVLTRSPSL